LPTLARLFFARTTAGKTVTTKSDCIDFLSRNLIRTSQWRRTQAARFANDLRNERASKALWQLATAATEISDDQWRLLSLPFNPRDERWCEVVSGCSRDVGFRSNPQTFDAYVQTIIDAVVLA
jgi:hypothetical protein